LLGRGVVSVVAGVLVRVEDVGRPGRMSPTWGISSRMAGAAALAGLR
jgi:hypothetical protein